MVLDSAALPFDIQILLLPAFVPVIGCVPVLLVLQHANGSCQHEGQLAHCDQLNFQSRATSTTVHCQAH